MKNIGKPCAGEPHARFDEGGQERGVPVLYSTRVPCESHGLPQNRGVERLPPFTQTGLARLVLCELALKSLSCTSAGSLFSPSSRQTLRTQAEQQRKQRVGRRMPGLGRASGEPHRNKIRETQKPRGGYPCTMFEPHVSLRSCRSADCHSCTARRPSAQATTTDGAQRITRGGATGSCALRTRSSARESPFVACAAGWNALPDGKMRQS